jgi:hypothetical protein
MAAERPAAPEPIIIVSYIKILRYIFIKKLAVFLACAAFSKNIR